METTRREMEMIKAKNKNLKDQYNLLSDRLSKMETKQLSNNAIISGVPEEPWETYSSTMQTVHDVIEIAIQDKFPDKESALTEAKSFDISYCTRVGKLRTSYLEG